MYGYLLASELHSTIECCRESLFEYNGLLYGKACTTTAVKLTVLLRSLIKRKEVVVYKTHRGHYCSQSLQSKNPKLLPRANNFVLT